MTSARAQAYGRLIRLLDDKDGTRLLPEEVEVVRAAADTLLFADGMDDAARDALGQVEALVGRLVDSGRWDEGEAERLLRKVDGCGPRAAPVL
jgi:hypothetical protein